MNESLSPYSVYTIRHSDELNTLFEDGEGSGCFTEHKIWRSAQKLLDNSQRDGTRLPVIFAASEKINGLIYWGIIESVQIEEHSTTYHFTNLQPIRNNPPLSSLILKNKKKPLSENYIRPYAIVYTPDFIE